MEMETKIGDVKQDFLEAIYDGQKRAEKFGYRVSAVLLKLISPLDETTINEATDFVKSTLRKDDSFYSLGNGLFGAILPDTHEAGGEAAARRLKRFFQRALTNLERDSLPQISVGVVSIGPNEKIAPERILHLLKRDLELDIECLEQELSGELNDEIVSCKHEQIQESRPQVVIASDNFDIAVELKAQIEGDCDVWICSDIVSFKEVVSSKTISAVAVLFSDLDKVKDITEILQSDRKLDSTFKVLMSKAGDIGLGKEFDVVLENDSVAEVAQILRLGTRIGWLQGKASKAQKWAGICESVSKATHKLNQPLQVILGKIEIIVLDYEEDHPELAERLREIRKQALKAAEINHKIARLVQI